MLTALMDALIDSVKMIPWLFGVYLVIELLEHKWGEKLARGMRYAGKGGPLVGAVLGALPQCGFSVVISSLYVKRVITVGTLLAVYLSTSDEAIPVILAHPDQAGIVFPLIGTKVIIGVAAGYLVDSVLQRPVKFAPLNQEHLDICHACNGHWHRHASSHTGGGSSNQRIIPVKPLAKELLFHSLVNTLKVFIFIFAVTLLINLVIFKIGAENLGKLLLAHSVLQPVITALVGLIPNCAASVIITQAFLEGVISYGSAISGLCAGAGLGLLVLLRENKSFKDTAMIVGMLLGVSITCGIGIQYFYG